MSRLPNVPWEPMHVSGDARPLPIRVLVALMTDTPEEALLRQALGPAALVSVVDTRGKVLVALNEETFDVIVLPVQGRDRLATAPLIRMCLRQTPSSTILVLCVAPPSRSGALLAASRAGAQVLVAPTAVDISSALTRATRLATHDVVLDCEALASVEPPMLQELLCAASKTVATDGRVRTFAKHLQISTRTLSRYTHRLSLMPPRTLLSAARLLWACALMESSRYDMSAVARTTGFRDLQALTLETRRHRLPLSATTGTRLAPYRDALRFVVESLGGRLAAR